MFIDIYESFGHVSATPGKTRSKLSKKKVNHELSMFLLLLIERHETDEEKNEKKVVELDDNRALFAVHRRRTRETVERLKGEKFRLISSVDEKRRQK